MSEFGEIWDGPGDDWYPGDDDEEFKLDQAEAADIDRDAAREALHEYDCTDPGNPAWGDCAWGVVTDDDGLYPECEHTPPCTGDREDAPCYDDELGDPRPPGNLPYYDDGITTDDFDHWPGEREFPS